MSFQNVREYLFTRSYPYYLFKKHLRSLKLKDQRRVKALLSKSLLIRKQVLATPKVHIQTVVKVRHNLHLLTYLKIEKELIKLVKLREEKVVDELNDYEFGLLEPAVERVAGLSLSSINNDSEFDQKLIQKIILYRRWYYHVTYTYKLPTIRIVPFILRIVSKNKRFKL